jgi:hypothetical protein
MQAFLTANSFLNIELFSHHKNVIFAPKELFVSCDGHDLDV